MPSTSASRAGEGVARTAHAIRASIVQAAGEHGRAVSYGTARGAALQAVAHIECCRCLRIIEPTQYDAAMRLLTTLLAKLTRLAR